MQIVAVAFLKSGERVEGILTLPDHVTEQIADVGQALARTRIKFQHAVEVAAENMYVAHKDFHEAKVRRELEDEQFAKRVARGEKEPLRGPDQIAFAGTREPAVQIPNTGNTTHEKALAAAGFVKDKAGRFVKKEADNA